MASAKTPVSISQTLTLEIDQSDTNNIYIGRAKTGTLTSAADWQIAKLVTSGGVISLKYAGGVPAFSNIWDNRASLTYS